MGAEDGQHLGPHRPVVGQVGLAGPLGGAPLTVVRFHDEVRDAFPRSKRCRNRYRPNP
jgi:hypothetical protein